MVGLSLGGSPRFTHMEPLKLVPAPPHQGVAVIRPAHTEGKHLLGGKAGGTWEGLDPELPPSFPPWFLLRSTGTSTYLELLYLHQSCCTD